MWMRCCVVSERKASRRSEVASIRLTMKRIARTDIRMAMGMATVILRRKETVSGAQTSRMKGAKTMVTQARALTDAKVRSGSSPAANTPAEKHRAIGTAASGAANRAMRARSGRRSSVLKRSLSMPRQASRAISAWPIVPTAIKAAKIVAVISDVPKMRRLRSSAVTKVARASGSSMSRPQSRDAATARPAGIQTGTRKSGGTDSATETSPSARAASPMHKAFCVRDMVQPVRPRSRQVSGHRSFRANQRHWNIQIRRTNTGATRSGGA